MKNCILLALAPLFVQAQNTPFPPLYNSEPGEPMTALEAAEKFTLPPDVRVQVFASEPAVQNPIASAWDARGRLWVAENYTYAERKMRFDLSLRDRLIILHDRDGDGQAEHRTVFSDNLQMLTSVATDHDGVWVMCPPHLLFIPDRNQDDQPDGPPQVMLDGFTVAKSNYHNFANGLRWGPDGWLYGRCGHSCPGKLGIPGTSETERLPMDGGIWRFHPKHKTVEVLTHGTTNPWGHDWDQHGQGFYINTVNGHLWHLIPGAHYKESWGPSPNPLVYERLDTHADHFHYDTTGKWTASRDGKANAFGGGHSHVGMMIYQADHFPASFQHRLFTWNTHGRRANRERLERLGSGYVGKHEPDVFLAGDPWFRGMEITTGPDGAIYGLDWSDTEECHEHSGVHRTSGRIYRFTYKQNPKVNLVPLGNITAALQHPNPWFERQARRRLQAHDEARIRTLLKHSDTTVRLRALWALNQLEVLQADELTTVLTDPDEHLRAWAIRLLSDHWPIDGLMGPMPHQACTPDESVLREFTQLAKTDTSGLVRLTLASTLQRLPLDQRRPLAQALSAHRSDAEDHNLPAMVWYGMSPLSTHRPADLVALAETTTWPSLLRWIARACATQVKEHPQLLEDLLQQATQNPTRATHLLAGINEGFKGWRTAPRPANWTNLTAVLQSRNDCQQALRALRSLFGDGQTAAQLEAIVFDARAEMEARKTALQTLINQRPEQLREICRRAIETRALSVLALRGLASFEAPEIGQSIAKNYHTWFGAQERPAVIDTLASRPSWAAALLAAMDAGTIPREDLTPFHARQIHGLGDEALRSTLARVWGSINPSTAENEQQIAALKSAMSPQVLAKANLGNGRVLYQSLCSSCHRLYGEGVNLGPDLTGSGRMVLDYLLDNIVDPSAVVSASYQLQTISLKDGRQLSGVIAEENERALTLRQLNEETTILRTDIARQQREPISIMPAGLLNALRLEQQRDLLGYLMHPKQVPPPQP